MSEWSDKYRILSPEDSAEPGQWRTSRMEPMRAIMDCFNEPLVEEIALQKGTQIGFTAVLGNIIGYTMDQDPSPMLLMQPTKAMAEEWSKARLAPMLRDTPRLAGKVRDPKSRDSGNTILSKEFPGGRLAIIGANAPAEIASRPIKLVLCDETDRYPASAGTEGDPMKLAEKRQETFWNRKRFKGSSPTVKGQSAIEREYARSDKRRYYVCCHKCNHAQTLRWEQVKWDKVKGEDGKHVHHPETAHYQCEQCGELWTDAERWHAVSVAPRKGAGWKATAPFRGIAGFHLSQLYSSWVKLDKMVTEFLTAYGKLPGTYPDPNLMKVFTNTVLAETWEEQGETVDKEGVANRAEPYGPDDLPDEAVLATAGVDVQDNRLEVQIVAWGADDEAWAARYEVLFGDPAQETVWEELDELLKEPLQTVSGRLVRVRAACVDAGGHFAAQVHAFCRSRLARRIYQINGANGARMIWPVRQSRSKYGSVYLIGVDTAKDAIYGRLKIPARAPGEPNPGFIHFPLPSEESGTEGFGSDYYEQLTVERVETRYREGKPYRVWVKKNGQRNEALDTIVYALAARKSLPWKIRGSKILAAKPEDEPAPAEEPKVLAKSVKKSLPPAPVLAKVTPKKPRRDPAAIARMFHR
ncbi:MAG: phage terminase large subunit family protein [Hyphomicrobium sp.]|uniref:phage terminase large subunit family protein n=1 Tax=Hyphomicrobium sp. TaxID=82 RepID=UPI003D134784